MHLNYGLFSVKFKSKINHLLLNNNVTLDDKMNEAKNNEHK